VGPPGEAWIMADGRRMEQVLENLLVNALRYVPSGGRVEARLEAATGRDPRHRLTVSDDGPGVPDEELPLVFRRFYRGAASARRGGSDPGGSGLGLAIVREIVERHGGTAHAEAGSPRGLVILIQLPALVRS
jgi:signal transduction histidine kinase